MATPPPVPPNVLSASARVDGFSHGQPVSWALAVGLVEALAIDRHVDLGDRECYFGRHPELGTIAVILSSIGTCHVMSCEDLGSRLQSSP